VGGLQHNVVCRVRAARAWESEGGCAAHADTLALLHLALALLDDEGDEVPPHSHSPQPFQHGPLHKEGCQYSIRQHTRCSAPGDMHAWVRWQRRTPPCGARCKIV